MTASELKQKYLDFFIKKNHQKLPNVSLIPENDPTTLFISAGMQPLVPYLLGEPHPLGKRLVSLQRCLRTGDIDKVGNTTHMTFFEMLGNWSLGDYWKKESLSWSLEFLTEVLDLDKNRLHVTVFAGDKNAPKDEEAEKAWLSLGIPRDRIYPLPKEDNWWEAGATGPGGPDSEIFYDIGKPPCGSNCRPGDGCGRFFEVWNNVFMEYNRQPNGVYEKLKQKNVDTGMGVERTTVVLEGRQEIYQTELFSPMIQIIENLAKKKYEGENQKPMRIIADHLRAATFLLGDGVEPSNKDRGYVLRRLIRRAVRFAKTLEVKQNFTSEIAKAVIEDYQKDYPNLIENKETILTALNSEEARFQKTLDRGLKEFEKIVVGEGVTVGEDVNVKIISGEKAFELYETYGFPLELTEELAREKGLAVDKAGLKRAQKQHQEKSRASLEKKFAGGLADNSETVTKFHTATHLLHQALRQILGEHVHQVGSNITPERLRFDFTHPKSLTPEEIKKVADLVNKKIKENLPVKMEMMSLAEAKKQGALAFFVEKYGEQVKVYSIGDFSKEVCGGPHVNSTGEIGGIKIIKEQAIGAGRRRIYAQLTNLAHGS